MAKHNRIFKKSFLHTWVDFLVSGNTIGVNNVLESFSKLISLEISGRRVLCVHTIENRRYS